MLRELALEGGGFASAQDADTDGVEGLTFTWTPDEGVPDELLRPFEHGRFVLRGELDRELRARLLELRERRPKPARDDKAIASWNGLALAALAEAGAAARPRRLARRGARLGGVPARAAVDRGRPAAPHLARRAAKGTGYLEDYANVANGLYELHVATGELRWLEEATGSRGSRSSCSRDDERGGFFQTPGRRRAARRAQEGLRRPPERRAATRCSPTCCSGWRGSTATTSSSGARSSVLRLVRGTR